MFPANFDYVRAESVDHALGLLASDEDAKLIAGGHSLLPMLKLRLAQPSKLIDIGRLADLRGIELQGSALRIGALVTHYELESSPLVAQHVSILREAARAIADPAVRNRGTVGGNIAHADPASDLPAVLVALGATVHLRGQGGPRQVAAGEFFVGLLTSAMEPGEILTHVEVPVLGKSDSSAYLKFEHPASGYTVCGAAAVIRGGRATLAFNGVADHPFTAPVPADLSDAALEAAAGGIEVEEPMSDRSASGPYRVHLAKVYGKRALFLARDRAQG